MAMNLGKVQLSNARQLIHTCQCVMGLGCVCRGIALAFFHCYIKKTHAVVLLSVAVVVVVVTVIIEGPILSYCLVAQMTNYL
jgi:hypothetical protein